MHVVVFQQDYAVSQNSIQLGCQSKVGIPNFVSGPGEYIMEGEYVILKITGLLRASAKREASFY